MYDTVIHRGGPWRWDLVDAPGRERAAARDPPRGEKTATDRSMCSDRPFCVVRARGVEAALPAEPARQRPPVDVDQTDERCTRRRPEQPHRSTPASHRRITCARDSNSSTSATSSDVRAPAIAALATSATSCPPSTRGASSRHAARRMRRARLRTTAPPTRRPATNAADPGPEATNTTTRSPWNAWPVASSRPTSRRLVGVPTRPTRTAACGPSRGGERGSLGPRGCASGCGTRAAYGGDGCSAGTFVSSWRLARSGSGAVGELPAVERAVYPSGHGALRGRVGPAPASREPLRIGSQKV